MVEGMCKVYKHEELSMAFWKRNWARSIFIQVFSLWCRLIQPLGDLNGLVEMRTCENGQMGRSIPVLFGDGQRFGVGLGNPHEDGVKLTYTDLFEVADVGEKVRPEHPGVVALHYFVYLCQVGLSFNCSLVLMICSIWVGISNMKCLPSQGFSSSWQLLARTFKSESSVQAIWKLISISALMFLWKPDRKLIQIGIKKIFSDLHRAVS